MSKAEDLSKQYKDYREQCGIKDPVMLNEIEEAYFEGYRQAEKDFELTWKDISIIREILCGIVGYPLIGDKEVCTEVLKRFKAKKDNECNRL